MHAVPQAMLASASRKSPSDALGEDFARDLILQVEDNDCVAGLVALMLDRAGRRVLRARDGAEGELLFAAHAREIGLVMLDCRLPDTDGMTLCRRLRAVRPGLPVLFTTGHMPAGARDLADERTGFITKPFLPGPLARQVNSLLSRGAGVVSAPAEH